MYRLMLLAVFILASAVWAQDTSEEDATASEVEEEAEAESPEGLTEEEFEELDIDSQEDHTEDEEDVFKPTDEVSYEQSLEFPVDI